jgi:hypothetical protein
MARLPSIHPHREDQHTAAQDRDADTDQTDGESTGLVA